LVLTKLFQGEAHPFEQMEGTYQGGYGCVGGTYSNVSIISINPSLLISLSRKSAAAKSPRKSGSTSNTSERGPATPNSPGPSIAALQIKESERLTKMRKKRMAMEDKGAVSF
jgi:hypothetical protein